MMGAVMPFPRHASTGTENRPAPPKVEGPAFGAKGAKSVGIIR